MSEICITYGQTEASPATTMSKITDPLEVRVNTVGGPIFGVECKVVDPETGEDLPDNQDGEFLARGYNICLLYTSQPDLQPRNPGRGARGPARPLSGGDAPFRRCV